MAGAETDAGLVRSLREGDVGAFDALYRAHVGAVAAVVRASVRDADQAAEIVQEVFFRALQRIEGLRQPESFRAWVLSIARHAVTDHHRHVSRLTPLDESVEPIVDPGAALRPAELREVANLVRGLIGGLSARDAAALTMVIEFDVGPREVATAHGITVNAAKVRLHRARRRLLTALAMQLLVRGQNAGCDELESLRNADDVDAIAQHAPRCPRCLHTLGSDLEVYMDTRSTA